ncbi:hypothetical protein [Streptomyces mirabilis]|uniref:hypothetical protein n=1 Tax=Streptomyces mirabilis TaxID=68239 RepID=UPI0036EC7CB0
MANFRFGSNDYTVNIRAQQHVNFVQGWDTHRLALAFEVTADGGYAVDAPFLVSGALRTHEMPNPASWVGILHATAGPIGLKSFGTMLTLETTVTEQQLRGLEKMRAVIFRGFDCSGLVSRLLVGIGAGGVVGLGRDWCGSWHVRLGCSGGWPGVL